MLAVSVDLDMKWVDGMSVEDRRVELVGMDGGLIQVSGGTSPDQQEPMASEEQVGQGDWSA